MTPEELLKEVGEPVLYAEFAEDGGWLGDASEYADHLEEPHALFTSDQVAAAILKATKPLEDQLAKAERRIAELIVELDHTRKQKNLLWFEFSIATQKLAAAQEEIEQLRAALDAKSVLHLDAEKSELKNQLAKAEQFWQIAQGRCDGLEEKLAKAEQRVAEACALQVATETRFHWLDAARVAKEIRSGEWRKFVKGVAE